jgi:hypothetical protein
MDIYSKLGEGRIFFPLAGSYDTMLAYHEETYH